LHNDESRSGHFRVEDAFAAAAYHADSSCRNNLVLTCVLERYERVGIDNELLSGTELLMQDSTCGVQEDPSFTLEAIQKQALSAEARGAHVTNNLERDVGLRVERREKRVVLDGEPIELVQVHRNNLKWYVGR